MVIGPILDDDELTFAAFMGGVLRPPEFSTQIVDSSKVSVFLSKVNNV
jgi:hypothetical protein